MSKTGNLCVAALLGVSLAAAVQPGQASADGPVLVELFTSQGCNSCPPADLMLERLAEREDVIALSYHVTYWDRLGWPDTFGDPAYDTRQRDYGKRLGRGLYTPQMVIAGQADVVGGHPAIPAAIDEFAAIVSPAPIAIDASGALSLPELTDAATLLWAAAVERRADVEIRRGENRGKTLAYHNIVREFTSLDPRHPEPLPLAAWQKAGHDMVVVAAQNPRTGEILALGKVALGAGS